MVKRKDRVVIDTNLWISFLLSKQFSQLDSLFANDSIVLLFSQELLEEFIEVATRSKFKKYFHLSDIQHLLEQIEASAEFINVTSDIEVCRDPKDDFLLSLANDGNAHFLLTGDNDLLALKKIGKTKILTFRKYIDSKVTK